MCQRYVPSLCFCVKIFLLIIHVSVSGLGHSVFVWVFICISLMSERDIEASDEAPVGKFYVISVPVLKGYLLTLVKSTVIRIIMLHSAILWIGCCPVSICISLCETLLSDVIRILVGKQCGHVVCLWPVSAFLILLFQFKLIW